jgi:hypothetical protein
MLHVYPGYHGRGINVVVRGRVSDKRGLFHRLDSHLEGFGTKFHVDIIVRRIAREPPMFQDLDEVLVAAWHTQLANSAGLFFNIFSGHSTEEADQLPSERLLISRFDVRKKVDIPALSWNPSSKVINVERFVRMYLMYLTVAATRNKLFVHDIARPSSCPGIADFVLSHEGIVQ